MGWISIYAAVYNEEHQSILDTTQKYGKQLIWIGTSIVLIIAILFMDGRLFEALAIPIYVVNIVLLALVLIVGKEISGAKSWFAFGSFSLQPSEFAKFATALAVARYLSLTSTDFSKFSTKVISVVLFAIPALLIALQPDMGSVLVYAAFVFVLYREGLSGYLIFGGLWLVLLFIMSLLVDNLYLTISISILALIFMYLFRKNKPLPLLTGVVAGASIGFVYLAGFIFNNVLAPHQKSRFNILLGLETDYSAAGYNTHQSLIAIGSGGFSGKGFLKGTQTKLDFVPEQSTDYIFCTVGEEWGYIGTSIVILLFTALFFRIIYKAEKQKTAFSRIYGYAVASIIFIHFTINIGMAIGLLPVIGIPLPFFSYGGSSLWGFTILLFIFLKLDAYQWEIW
jgi:rod shape determining protein RodA